MGLIFRREADDPYFAFVIVAYHPPDVYGVPLRLDQHFQTLDFDPALTGPALVWTYFWEWAWVGQTWAHCINEAEGEKQLERYKKMPRLLTSRCTGCHELREWRREPR